MSDQKCCICQRDLLPPERYVWRGKLYCDGCLFEPGFPGEEKPSAEEIVYQCARALGKSGIVISDRWGRKHQWTDEYVMDHLKTIFRNLRMIE